MSEFFDAAWHYIREAIATVGFFVTAFVGIAGALFGGVAMWPAWGWWTVMASLVWLTLWLSASIWFDGWD